MKVWLGLTLGLLLLLACIVFVPKAPALNLSETLATPSWAHPFGCDEDGRDLLQLVVLGARVSLSIGLLSVMLTATVGTVIGIFVAYRGGKWDEFFVWLSDVILAFPSTLLIIALAALQSESSIVQVVLLLSAVGWVGFARMARAQVLSLKERDFIKAAELIGCRFPRLCWHHLLPNLRGPLLVQASFSLAGLILAESTLSFLGLGVPATVPSWGKLIDQGVQYLLVAPHLVFFPGLAIMLSILAFQYLGQKWEGRYAVSLKI